MLTKSILVLEKNATDFAFLVEELSELGYSERNFYNCRSLKELSDPAVATFSPEFIFADLNLPDSPSSTGTFLHIQTLFSDVPIVVVAGLKNDGVAIKCLELGAQNYLEKGSFNGDVLLKVIAYSTERNLVKLELEKLKADYQNLFNENPLALLLADKNTSKFHHVNKAAINKYGYEYEEFKNLTVRDLYESTRKEINEKQSEETASYSCHYNKSGETLYVEVNNTEIVYKNIPSQLITVNDITDKVIAEEKERKAKQRLDAIFNGTHDAILLTDDTGKFIQVNSAASIILQYTQEQFLSLSVADILVSEKARSEYDDLWDRFLNDQSQSGIIELRNKEGKIIICHYNATANVLPGVHLSILTDITERENARKKIEEQGKKIENILDSITDCFFATDKNWIVQYWNKAAEQLMGMPREKIVGYNLWEVYKDSVGSKAYDAYHKVMNEQVAVFIENYYSTSKRWYDVSAYPAADGITVYFKDITYRRKESIEVLETKNNQAALINSSNDLIWSVDTEMKMVSFNTAYKTTVAETTGIAISEGIQLPLDHYNAGTYQQWKGYYARGLAGEAFTIVLPIFNQKTGKIKQAEVSFNPVFTVDKNTVQALACYSHDITQRLQYQSLIEEQNERLRSNEDHLKKLAAKLEKVMNRSLDMICSVRRDGTFTQVSDASKTILGYLPEELIGRRFHEIIAPEYLPLTEKSDEEVVLGKSFTNFQNVYIHKNGNRVPIIWSKKWDEEEETMFCVARDATALIEAEKLKAESEQRLTALVQKGADMVAIIDTDSDYVYISPNVKQVLGYEPEMIVDTNALSYIHPDDVKLAAVYLKKAKTEDEVNLGAIRHTNAQGEWRWLETIATNQLDNPAIKGIVLNCRDITDRKQIETEREQMIKELLKSNADLKQFSFITSHNLRAPLSNITGILNIIDYPTLDPYNGQMLEMLKTSANQLGQTIDDLAKILIIKNNVSIELSHIDLQETISAINKTFLNTLNDVCAYISTDFKVPAIVFNKVYFESILVNLLSNSIKYRSANRSLIITISTDTNKNGNIVFRFSDNGSGIDTRMHKKKLFGLYQRFHDTAEGQGLGLFIIKSQIVALGGSIDLESEPDKGTTFIITLKKQPGISENEENIKAALEK